MAGVSTQPSTSQSGFNNSSGSAFVAVNRSDPAPNILSSSAPAVSGHGWEQGVISYQPGLNWVREIQVTITTPNDYPGYSDSYYVVLSVYDSGLSYDQIGIYPHLGGWLFIYSYTSGGPTGRICSATPTYHDTFFSWVPGTTDSLAPNTQYTFGLEAYSNGTIGFLFALGNSLKYLFNESYAHTGGTAFDLNQFFYCNDGIDANYFEDFTEYEEVETTTQTVWPDWSFTFYDDYVATSIGGALTQYTYWATYSISAPTGVASTIFSSGNVIIANQGGNVTLNTGLGSGKISTFYVTPGGSVTTPSSVYQTCCSGGGLSTLFLFTFPAGWTYWFNPNRGTPGFTSTLLINVSSSATAGTYRLEAGLSWSNSDFTLVLFYIIVNPSGGGGGEGGGGGCVAWGTPILVHTSGYSVVQRLGAGLTVEGYWFSNDTRVMENVTWNNFTWANETLSINGGLLVTTLQDQPLFVKNGSWTGVVRDPINLTVGEYLYNPISNAWIRIANLTTVLGVVPVFDLREDRASTFVAGDPVLAQMKFDGSNED